MPFSSLDTISIASNTPRGSVYDTPPPSPSASPATDLDLETGKITVSYARPFQPSFFLTGITDSGPYHSHVNPPPPNRRLVSRRTFYSKVLAEFLHRYFTEFRPVLEQYPTPTLEWFPSSSARSRQDLDEAKEKLKTRPALPEGYEEFCQEVKDHYLYLAKWLNDNVPVESVMLAFELTLELVSELEIPKNLWSFFENRVERTPPSRRLSASPNLPPLKPLFPSKSKRNSVVSASVPSSIASAPASIRGTTPPDLAELPPSPLSQTLRPSRSTSSFFRAVSNRLSIIPSTREERVDISLSTASSVSRCSTPTVTQSEPPVAERTPRRLRRLSTNLLALKPSFSTISKRNSIFSLGPAPNLSASVTSTSPSGDPAQTEKASPSPRPSKSLRSFGSTSSFIKAVRRLSVVPTRTRRNSNSTSTSPKASPSSAAVDVPSQITESAPRDGGGAMAKMGEEPEAGPAQYLDVSQAAHYVYT